MSPPRSRCSHASVMECDTFSCVIKSRVTRALYIIHAATPPIVAAFTIAHPEPFLFPRSLSYHHRSFSRSLSLFLHFSFLSFILFHHTLGLNIPWTGTQFANTFYAQYTDTHGNFHRLDKICLRNIYRCSPLSTIVSMQGGFITLNFR